MSDKADLLADMECRNMHGDANENLVISSGEVVSNLEVSSQPHACGKYRVAFKTSYKTNYRSGSENE